MGVMDKMIRVSVALIIGALYLVDAISGTVAIVLGVLSLIFVVTSFISFCPLYWPFKFSTLEPKARKSKRR